MCHSVYKDLETTKARFGVHKAMIVSGNPSVTVSDAARAELLRRYGGTYMDLDALTLRPLPNTTNWLGRITDDVITNAVMSFTPGHQLLQVRR